jgi:TatD DNase family protein
MIDSHAHLDFVDFDHDRAELFTQMVNQGISTVLIPGVSSQHWSKQLAIAKEFDCFYALGIHPWYCPDAIDLDLVALDAKIADCRDDPKLLALGECGLDKVYQKSPFLLQNYLLEKQLQLAIKWQLPVILHCVKAHNELINWLKRYPNPRGGVIHGFYGGPELANQYIQLGYKLGIGGLILDAKAKKLQLTVAALSLDSFIIETDSPSMTPFNDTIRRNSPLNLPRFVAQIAFLTNSSTVSVLEQLDVNFLQLFDL